MVKQLTKEEFLAIKNRANAAGITYDKSAFIGSHTEDYVDVYRDEGGFVFIMKASSPNFDASRRYDDWNPEKHSDDAGYEHIQGKVKHCRGYW